VSRYVQRYDEEGFEVPLETVYRIGCCDCGLVHDVVWVIQDGKLGMAARRNNRATAQKRRKGNRLGIVKENPHAAKAPAGKRGDKVRPKGKANAPR
jgi:hypothetical protein